ncbi:MAG: threonine-phosphate decarboxylase CobD [Pseudomonadota bacterium]
MRRDLVHGGALDIMRSTYPNAPLPWVDLSTGINPWPYPCGTPDPAAFAHLPTLSEAMQCREAWAATLGVVPDALLLAPGSELLIRMLPDIIRPRSVAIVSPTYGDHAESWQRSDATVTRISDPSDLPDHADCLVVTNPNNPDGRIFDPDELDRVRHALVRRGGWLIVDEAYADLSPQVSLAPKAGAEGLIILRSFGKFYGLAGVRLGAMLAPEPVRTAVADRLGAWPVSTLALSIGTQAFADTSWQSRTRSRLAEAAARLDAFLSAAGMEQITGTTLFRYVRVKKAHGVFARLAEAGIYVRRFRHSASHLRIGLPATDTAGRRLADALRASSTAPDRRP